MITFTNQTQISMYGTFHHHDLIHTLRVAATAGLRQINPPLRVKDPPVLLLPVS